MTKKEVIALVGMLFAAYPKFEVPKETVQVYQQFMLDLDADLAKAAVIKHIATSKFFPTIAELRDAVIDFNNVPIAADAWAEVMQQLKSVGGYGNPKFSHPAIKKAVDVIGWTNLCMSEQIGVERAHFLKAYDTYRGREIENAKVSPVLEKLGIKMPDMPALPEGVN